MSHTGFLTFRVSELCVISMLACGVISVSSNETEKALFLLFRNGVYSN